MQLNCEMPGCAEQLIGKVPICAKCRQRVPHLLYTRIKQHADQGKFNAEYRGLLKQARNSILKAAATVEKSITEVENELDKKLDELYPPHIVDAGITPPMLMPSAEPLRFYPAFECLEQTEDGRIRAVRREQIYPPALTDEEIEAYIKPEVKKVGIDAQAEVQALNWLVIYSVLVSIAFAGALIILWGGSQQ